MAKIWLERPLERHAEALERSIPPEDDEDMRRGWGMSSRQGLRLQLSRCPDSWAILRDAEDGGSPGVCAIFGCESGGAMWLIRGEDMKYAAIPFIRRSGPVIDAWIARYGRVEGYFNLGYGKLARWLERAGFTVEEIGGGYARCSKGFLSGKPGGDPSGGLS